MLHLDEIVHVGHSYVHHDFRKAAKPIFMQYRPTFDGPVLQQMGWWEQIDGGGGASTKKIAAEGGRRKRRVDHVG